MSEECECPAQVLRCAHYDGMSLRLWRSYSICFGRDDNPMHCFPEFPGREQLHGGAWETYAEANAEFDRRIDIMVGRVPLAP